MKKYIITLLTIGTFSVYMIYQHVSGQDPTVSTNAIVSPSFVDVTPVFYPPPPQQTVSIKTSSTAPSVVHTKIQTGEYKDGQYTGVSADAYYGNIQVQATISGGRLTDVVFLDYPHDRGTSVRINTRAIPVLKSEAIAAKSANVSTVSGASDSSGAFRTSLASALAQAKNS